MQMNIEFHARRTDPETSHEAAARVREFAGEHHRRILAAIDPVHGSTIYDIADMSGMDHVAVARRMIELASEVDGRIARVKAKGTRPGPTGRMCRVWWLA